MKQMEALMLKLYVQARETALRFVKNESGASLAEYALLIALVLVGVGVTLEALTGAITGAIARGTAELTPAAPGTGG